MPDLVSVIVPVYNSEKVLSGCVDSILHQTYDHLEIILINDGSTDNSGNLCTAYARDDARVKTIHTRNSGPAAARNVGLENSNGAFIFFLDSDDSIESHAIHALMESYSRFHADTIIGDFRTIQEDRLGPGHKGVFPESKLLSKLDIMEYARCYLRKPNRYTLFAYSWGRLFRSSIIKQNRILFDPDLHTYEDVAFNFAYMKHADAAYYLKEELYNHRVHDNYMSATMMLSDNPKRMFGYGPALANIGEFLMASGSGEPIRPQVGHANICLTIIQLVRICGQVNRSNSRYIYSLIHSTISDPVIRGYLQCYAPTEGDSRIVPLLIRLRLVWPIIWVCRYKARKRYGKKRGLK